MTGAVSLSAEVEEPSQTSQNQLGEAAAEEGQIQRSCNNGSTSPFFRFCSKSSSTKCEGNGFLARVAELRIRDLRQGPLVEYPCTFPMTSYLWSLPDSFTVSEGPDVEEVK